MRPRRREASAWLLVSLGTVGIEMLAGCEKVGGGKQAEQAASRPSGANARAEGATLDSTVHHVSQG